MYKQMEKLNGNKNRISVKSNVQTKYFGNLGFEFADCRTEAVSQKKMMESKGNQDVQRMQNKTESCNSKMVQLWKVRYQNMDTGVTAIVEDSLSGLPDEALREMAANEFENIKFHGEDITPEQLREMAAGTLEARRINRSRASERPRGRPLTGNALDMLEEQLQLPAEFGGMAAENPRLSGMRADFLRDATDVCIVRNGFEVYLDIDQLKHQPIAYPIGTRAVGGGNKFRSDRAGSPAWHRGTTLVHMLQWAEGLRRAKIGEQLYHGQANPVGGIHYEGYCVRLPDGIKLVLFHCYPANGSPLKM